MAFHGLEVCSKAQVCPPDDRRGAGRKEIYMIAIENLDEIAIVRLNNGVTNAIGPALVKDLSDALDTMKGEAKGMVLAGGEKFFSIGFNLPELRKLDRPGMGDFFYEFNQDVFRIFTLPFPTACAMTGHAIAGGTILSLGCDYRFLADGKKLMGLNEIKLGVPVPYLCDLILRQVAGDRAATEIVYSGEFIEPDQALEIKLVDEICPLKEVEACAVEKVSELAKLPRQAFEAIKENRVEAVRRSYEKNYRVKNDIFLDCWFSEPVQRLLAKAAEKF